MQPVRTIDLRPLLFHRKMRTQCLQESRGGQAVQVLHHPVIVDNGQLGSRETDRHEIVVLLVSPMLRILLRFFRTHKSGSSTAVMPVGNIEGRHPGKPFRNGDNVCSIIDDPKRMTEPVAGCDEVVNRLPGRIAGYKSIKFRIVGIGKKHRFEVSVVHPHVLHAVFLFVATCQFVLLDGAIQVVRYICPYHQAILCLAVHGLGIDIISFLLILHQPAIVLETLEILGSLLIDTRIVLVGSFREIDFGFDDMIQGFLVAGRFLTGLLRIEDIIRT